MTVATYPALVDPLETVPARIAMHAACPAAANNMSFLRPRLETSATEIILELMLIYRSISQIGIKDDRK